MLKDDLVWNGLILINVKPQRIFVCSYLFPEFSVSTSLNWSLATHIVCLY